MNLIDLRSTDSNMNLCLIDTALEYVGLKWRTFVANMCTAIYFGLGALLVPWIALWISDWKMLSIVLSAPLVLAIFTPWIVPESIRYCVVLQIDSSKLTLQHTGGSQLTIT